MVADAFFILGYLAIGMLLAKSDPRTLLLVNLWARVRSPLSILERDRTQKLTDSVGLASGQ